ncbi:1,2-phenylacetyl-CoA epoxidase subunit PaaD [Halosolutus gelatinilyticus]|uniref:1,2-phenylacetyl-CoA epoxidase subunit PaaD n=1 Tax=Halosolutus gelatinilyticus TaxID=2931975 RepID=UPI001FF14222|nr:1,2-phenylacetyl-CoA epoxidase subunit PaaD [Halosolutus gelatinilyticus]
MSGDIPDPGAKSDFTADTDDFALDQETDATPCAYTDYREGERVEDLPATGEGATGVEADVWEALYAIEDPEMPISIVDLGLLYGVAVEDGVATIDMTLTYSGCPARDMLTEEVKAAVANVDGVETAELRLVWSPEWTVEMVTDRGKDDLREFGLSV